MRFRHRDGTTVHLAYCTNVHPAEDIDGVLGQLERYATPIGERIGSGKLGVGLWLARDVASALTADESLTRRLGAELAARDLEVVTLNGFPYRGFQQPVVKHAVYSPDWASKSRLDYTLDLARLLTRLLPDDAPRGSVSSLPLGWRRDGRTHPTSPESTGDPTVQPRSTSDMRPRLDALAQGLSDIAASAGRPVRVGFEPEPGCLVETTADAATQLHDVDSEWLGISLDACHLAVAFEQPAAALSRLARAGLPVVKAQASCALEALDPLDPATRAALRSFVEPRFLHQTREGIDEAVGDGSQPAHTAQRADLQTPKGADDLDAALDGEDSDAVSARPALPGEQPWRVHFHVPVHADPAPPLAATRSALVDTLAELVGGPHARTDHIEVETYTWGVLPGAGHPTEDVVDGVAAELRWTRDRLLELGLEEIRP